MRRISKVEPQEYRTWRTPGEDWAPSYAAMGRDTRGVLESGLLREQGWLCCYCNARIDEHRMLVEHLTPQSGTRGTPLDIDYENLLASCPEQPGGVPTRSRSCGDRKGDRRLAVTPLDADCEDLFVYAADGGVAPAPGLARSEDAREALGILGLDSRRLQGQRALVLEPLIELFAMDPPVTEEELAKIRRACDAPGPEGRLPEFCVAVAQLLDRYGVSAPL